MLPPTAEIRLELGNANVTAGPYIVVTNSLTLLISAKGSVVIARLKSVSKGACHLHDVAHPPLFLSSCLLWFGRDSVVGSIGSECVLDPVF